MKITEYAISKRTVSYFLAIIIIGGGLMAYKDLGRLEFPTFTIKTAVVTTPYPGATAEEVEQEVTDMLEQAVQRMSQIKKVRSISQTNMSIIFVDIEDKYFSHEIPQIWDELRRKVSDAQLRLPPSAGPSQVNDDFSDVYGVFFAVTGDGYSYEEIEDYVDFLKRELLLVKNVASVDIWGNQQEAIYLTLSRARMAGLGISIKEILNTLSLQNQVKEVGQVKIDHDYIRINPTGEFTTVSDLGDLLVRSDGEGHLVYLKDLLTVDREYNDPPNWMMRYNGKRALGIGISTVEGGNVVEMGKAVRQRIEALKAERPVGMEMGAIAYQPDLVSESVKTFVVNLGEAVSIVILVLCLTMGISSAVFMGVILLLTIFGTFIVMRIMNIDLHLISLGALILALGMLVDNAIVITEGILVRVQQEMPRRKAALETVNQTAWPLLGATFVAVLAFAAIGTSKDMTGEFLMSLFLVMAISLGLSWILAITLTPLFCVQFLVKKKSSRQIDLYAGKAYLFYRRLLDICLRHRRLFLSSLFALMAGGILGLMYVEKSFFPNDSRNQFIINYWLPQGSHIEDTAAAIEHLEAYLASLNQVVATTTFVGQGALRFVLTYEPKMPNTSYGMLLVSVKDSQSIDRLISKLRTYISQHCLNAQVVIKKFIRGMDTAAKVEARFSGPDIKTLRQLSAKAQSVMAAEPLASGIQDDWRQKVMVLRPQVVEAKARRLGITRAQIADTIAMNFSGKTIGLYREKDELIPLIIKAPEGEREAVDHISDLVVASPASGKSVPLCQLVSGILSQWEESIIRRRNRKRTITVLCNPLSGNASLLFNRIRPKIEAIDLPPGYELQWGGEHEGSTDAQKALFKLVPLFFLAMVLTVVVLFNAFRQAVIIFLCLPLATIGVTSGLLLTGQPFGFMCILGFLGLSGMIIKNAVVLIDRIDLEIRSGKTPYMAVLDASISRLRPVTMAALTTVLGMLPLLKDVFFVGLSVTIIGGLTFGTVLTLLVVPVLYSMFFRLRS